MELLKVDEHDSRLETGISAVQLLYEAEECNQPAFLHWIKVLKKNNGREELLNFNFIAQIFVRVHEKR